MICPCSVIWHKITDVRPRKETPDVICVALWDVLVSEGFPLREVIIASAVCQLKMVGSQVPHELDCVSGGATADRTLYMDCNATLRDPFDQDVLQLQIGLGRLYVLWGVGLDVCYQLIGN